MFLGGGGVIKYVLTPPPAVSGFNAATLAWVAAVIANGGTVSAGRESLVDDLIVGLKAAGIFSKLDRLFLFAAENQPSALTDLVTDSLATAVNSPTFTTDRGYTENGSTSYVETNYNPFSQAINFGLNDAHVSAWVVVAGPLNNRVVDNTGGTHIYPNFAGGIYVRVNANAGGNFFVPDATGFSFGSRPSSSAVNVYKNGVSLGDTGATSSAVDNASFRCGDASATDQIACMSVGGNLDATQAASFYNLLRTYMTGVGVP